MKELKELAIATIDLVVCLSIWLVKAIALFIYLAKLSYQLGRKIGSYGNKTTVRKELPLLPPVILPKPLPESREQQAKNNSQLEAELNQSVKESEELAPTLTTNLPESTPTTEATVEPINATNSANDYQQWEQLAINKLRKLCKEKGLKPVRWTKQQCIDHLQNLTSA